MYPEIIARLRNNRGQIEPSRCHRFCRSNASSRLLVGDGVGDVSLAISAFPERSQVLIFKGCNRRLLSARRPKVVGSAEVRDECLHGRGFDEFAYDA